MCFLPEHTAFGVHKLTAKIPLSFYPVAQEAYHRA